MEKSLHKIFHMWRIFISMNAITILLVLMCNSMPVYGGKQPVLDNLAPLSVGSNISHRLDAIEVIFDFSIFDDLVSTDGRIRMDFPISEKEKLALDLDRFDVVGKQAAFFIGTPSGSQPMEIPRVVMFRGEVAGETGSHVFLAFTEQGSGNGYVTTAAGDRYILAHGAANIIAGKWGMMSVHKEGPLSDLPEDVPFCGVETPEDFVPRLRDDIRRDEMELAGPRIARIAIEADQAFCDIFQGNTAAAASYVVQLIGAVGDIYLRDVAARLRLDYVRVWPYGGEPFSADNISGFASYWYEYENPYEYNLIQLFSGRRDLPYGGVAYVSGTCPGWWAFAIEGRLNGSFPVPTGEPNRGNWDVNVVAHEMGHNFGTYHTHDGFDPTIDDCGNGIPSRGTIMSYCHIHPGYMLNIDLRFHALVQDVIRQEFEYGNCHDRDCNGNNNPDNEDITQGSSDDENSNGIPDECEDCNNNDILDEVDIAGGEPDVNGNGIPDICEPDCNENAIPDEYELQSAGMDMNGNNIPDECESDCNSNGFSDLVEIWIGAGIDLDRNYIPDDCQDCDDNDISDWIDLGRQGNLYVSDAYFNRIREYHQASGVPIKNFSGGGLSRPGYIAFGPDRQLYVSNRGNDAVIRVDVDNHQISTFVASGSGGLNEPQGLLFDPGGNLLVASQSTHNIIEYDGQTGVLIGDFVSPGTGGLQQPLAMVIGPNGNLFVATADNKVLEFSINDGSFAGEFVSAGSGGLDYPHGLAFKSNGNLLVVSENTNQVLEYEAETGIFLGLFNRTSPAQAIDNPRDIAIGPDGLIYMINGGNQWVHAYFPHNGLFFGGFVRGDGLLGNGYGLAFRPQSPDDCNSNGLLDVCDIAEGELHDADMNGIPDECESTDYDDDGVGNVEDNCPQTYNPDQTDNDLDGVGDLCDNCPAEFNVGQADYDGDGVGDLCDLCPGFDDSPDADGDGIPDGCDACPGYDDSLDGDSDGVPDDCDACPGFDDFVDTDFDHIADGCDNCPNNHNPDQIDNDGDDVGDLCDMCPGYDDKLDDDSDGMPDDCDVCPGYDDFTDTDEDGVPDGCDMCQGYDDYADGDGDTVPDSCDNCPGTPNTDQIDSDDDGIGDACDFSCGDANGDDLVNVGDAVFLINHVFKNGPPPDPICVGDANNDGIVNVADAVYLINYVFKDGPPPLDSCCDQRPASNSSGRHKIDK